MSLPGDADIPSPVSTLHLAITIDAPTDAVWPWIAQMGGDRAGWYSYDRLDNAGRPSLTRIDPDLQKIAVGDVFPALPGARDAFILTDLAPEEFLVLSVPGRDMTAAEPGTEAWRRNFNRANWTWYLTSPAPGTTRVLTRARLGYLELALPLIGLRQIPHVVAKCLAPVVHFIMGQRQLNRIRCNAEHFRPVIKVSQD